MAKIGRRINGIRKMIDTDAVKIAVFRGRTLITPKHRTIEEERFIIAKSLLLRLQVAKTGRYEMRPYTPAELGVALAKIDTWMLIRGWETEDGIYEDYQLDMCFDDIQMGEMNANQRAVTAGTC